jgi:hypothetical protein
VSESLSMVRGSCPSSYWARFFASLNTSYASSFESCESLQHCSDPCLGDTYEPNSCKPSEALRPLRSVRNQGHHSSSWSESLACIPSCLRKYVWLATTGTCNGV